MSQNDRDLYSDDMFADTRMTFGEHIEDLRTHMIRALKGFALAVVIGFFFAKPVLRFIADPVDRQLLKFNRERAKNAMLEAKKPRSKYFQMTFIGQQFTQAARGNRPRQLAQALPEEVRPLPYEDLAEQAQLLAAAANQALNNQEWKDLEQIAANLERTAEFLLAAERVPEGQQSQLAELAGRLQNEASALKKAAKKEDGEDCEDSLGRLGNILGDQGLMKLWVRIDDPVQFFAQHFDVLNQVVKKSGLSTLSVQEAFMAWVKVAMGCGLVLGSPWIFWQIWQFVAAGLYPNEKKLVNVYLPISLVLFLGGVLMCQFMVLPKAIEALLWFNHWLGMEPDLRFNEWLGFAILMPLVFGLSFQLPLVMMFLERIGIVTVDWYWKYWKISFFLIQVFAGIMVPSGDILSMELLAVPMCGLYALGILLCRLNPHPTYDSDVPDSEEMVGV